jgi:hypothetical protein
VRGEISVGHGGPKRARSRKRRKEAKGRLQPTKSPLLGGWFKAPFVIGVVPKTIMLLAIIWGGMSYVGWRAWSAISVEPVDRANLHVFGVHFRSAEPSAGILALPPDTFALVQVKIPRPEAFIDMGNIGKYKVTCYNVRTAIILSRPLGPLE